MYFLFIFFHFIGFSSYVSNSNPYDTVLSNTWDDLEAFHTDPYLSDEMIDDVDTFESNPHLSDETIINDADTSQNVIAIQESIESNNEEEKLPTCNTDNPTLMVVLGSKFQGKRKIKIKFQNLEPAISNSETLSQEELETKFYSLMNGPRPWKELKEYPLRAYLGYWGNVCDYFWKKSKPNDKRACFVNMFLFPETRALVYYNNPLWVTKAELLRCRCYYYKVNCKKPSSEADVFAIHKYKDNEYFILENKESRHSYYVIDYVSEARLPAPIA